MPAKVIYSCAPSVKEPETPTGNFLVDFTRHRASSESDLFLPYIRYVFNEELFIRLHAGFYH